jgi:hypothetical protein
MTQFRSRVSDGFGLPTEHRRRYFPQTVVWSLLVVFVYPIAGYLAHLAQRFEHVSIEHLVAEGPVEALDGGVLIRLAGLDVTQLNMIPVAPIREDL